MKRYKSRSKNYHHKNNIVAMYNYLSYLDSLL